MTRPVGARRAGAFVLAAAALGASFSASAEKFPYRVLHRISLSGGPPVQALAFGPGGRHFYAAVGDELRSYDAASGESGTVVKLPGAGVALAASGRSGGALYVATRSPARLLILGLKPLRITSSVPIRGGEPSEVLYAADTNSLFLESRAGNSISRLDPTSGKTLDTVHLHGRLEQMAANGRGTLYVANAADDELDVLETGKLTREGAIPLSGCSAPSGLAMDAVGRRLFVACGNGQALVLDEEMGFPFVRLPIAQGASLRTVFAMHPLGSGGWKGGAFMAGDAPGLDAIQMKAFISYGAGGSLPLGGRCTALAVSAPARRLVLALEPRVAGTASAPSSAAAGSSPQVAGVELWVLGGSNEEISP